MSNWKIILILFISSNSIGQVKLISEDVFEVEDYVLFDLAYKSSKYNFHVNKISLLDSEVQGLYNQIHLLSEKEEYLSKRDSISAANYNNCYQRLNYTVQKFDALGKINQEAEKEIVSLNWKLRKEKFKVWAVSIAGPVAGAFFYTGIKYLIDNYIK